MDASIFRLGWALDKVPQPWGYPGGKNKLTRTILAHVPAHTTYVEPFAGGAAVFFAKKPARKNVLNDLDPQVAGSLREFSCRGLPRCVAQHPPTIRNRERVTRRFRDGSTNTCDMFLARRMSFNSNGKDVYRGRIGNVGSRTLTRCAETEARLRKATITSEDFRKVAKEHDRPGVFQFWDPPYEGRAKGFYKFEEGTTPQSVCEVARSLKHAKVLITHYDKKDVRDACRGLHQKTVPHKYVSRNRNHGDVARVRELLVANYPI